MILSSLPLEIGAHSVAFPALHGTVTLRELIRLFDTENLVHPVILHSSLLMTTIALPAFICWEDEYRFDLTLRLVAGLVEGWGYSGFAWDSTALKRQLL